MSDMFHARTPRRPRERWTLVWRAAREARRWLLKAGGGYYPGFQGETIALAGAFVLPHNRSGRLNAALANGEGPAYRLPLVAAVPVAVALLAARDTGTAPAEHLAPGVSLATALHWMRPREQP